MTTTRRYTFIHDGVWAYEEGHATVQVVLDRRVARYWWYADPQVWGEEDQRLCFAFTVTGRDKWWAHQRAMDLAGACYWALSLSPRLVPTPTWEVLPPHTNRGRHRQRTEPASA